MTPTEAAMAVVADPSRTPAALAATLLALPNLPPTNVPSKRWYLVARALEITPDEAIDLCIVAGIDPE